MSENQQPKKRSKTKAETLHLNQKKKWEQVIQSVDKREVPVEVLERVSVNLIDGTEIEVNIKELLAEGYSSAEIERMLNKKFKDMDDLISNVDFFVDVESVQERVLPETLKVLKNL